MQATLDDRIRIGGTVFIYLVVVTENNDGHVNRAKYAQFVCFLEQPVLSL
jgi:hypothetical protein